MFKRFTLRRLALIKNSRIDRDARILSFTRFYGSTLGAYSYIGRFGLVQGTSIGRYCSISDSCIIGLPSHPVDWVSTSPVFHSAQNVFGTKVARLSHPELPKTSIGNDVWIGAGVLVKAGVTIGHGAIIGAGAIVTRDVGPFEIAVGNPARTIRTRFPPEVQDEVLDSEWWNLSPESLSHAMQTADRPLEFLRTLRAPQHIRTREKL